MTSARSPNISEEVPLPPPPPPYPREGNWSSIPLPPYPEVCARKGVSSKDDHDFEAKSIESHHHNFLSSDSNEREAAKEIEDEAPVSSSVCTGERGDGEWMLVSGLTLTTLRQEREDHVDGSIDEPSTPNTDEGTMTRFRGYVTGAKTAVLGNAEGVKDLLQKALPTLSLLPGLPALSTLTTLPTLPKVPALEALPFFTTWRTKAQAIRAERKAQAEVWTDNEKKVAQFEEAIHGVIDSGATSASTSTSPCVDKGQSEQLDIERGFDCVREVVKEEEWEENEGWDDFIS